MSFIWPLLGLFSIDRTHASDTLNYHVQHPIQEQHVHSLASISPAPLIDLHKSLVEIPSITGSEGNVTEFLKNYLRGNGLTVEAQDVPNGRQNILAYVGTSRETRVLVTSHVDTVPPFLAYERRGDEIWGRGTADAKGSVASQIIAYQDLVNEGRIGEGDVALLFVVGEEQGSDGMHAANDLGLAWNAVIFGEPTELKLASGHKGSMGFTITAKGKAAHSGYPELGKNANHMLIRALSALDGIQLPWSEHFGNSTVNVGRMEGGVASNVIPAEASASCLVRIAAGTPEELRGLIEDAVYEASPDVEVTITHSIGPVTIDHDIEGFETIVVNFGTDIPKLEGNHKRYLYGPGSILVAHSDHEHLTVSDLDAAVAGYKVLITETLK